MDFAQATKHLIYPPSTARALGISQLGPARPLLSIVSMARCSSGTSRFQRHESRPHWDCNKLGSFSLWNPGFPPWVPRRRFMLRRAMDLPGGCQITRCGQLWSAALGGSQCDTVDGRNPAPLYVSSFLPQFMNNSRF